MKLKIVIGLIVLVIFMSVGVFFKTRDYNVELIDSIFNGYTTVFDENGVIITQDFIEMYKDDYSKEIYYRISKSLKNKTTLSIKY